ncbi:MFS transporter [Catenuloplanes indicus]|uniref:MFS family permease n=1 Tax=Catenuloplanes indicus TaxID=137267 RepID=A0AAE3VY94_9ACTN|nr:MFS transporter [Catenuloplanes indicus]MDQ0366218.1 MFS family permease [Catenuloplanes indicus]
MFARWYAAMTTSQTGTAIGAVALPLTALVALDATPFQMGLIAAAQYVAWIVIGLPAGVLVRRLPLRTAQVGADLARFAAVVSVPLAWWAGVLTVGQLVAVALVTSFANVIFDVANSAFLVSIVPADQLQSRNSLVSGTHAATLLGGPSAGGVIVQLLGAVPTLLVDAASYLASAALLRTLPHRPAEAPDGRAAVVAQIREGWRYVTGHPIIGPCMWEATVINTINGAYHALFALYLVRDLNASPGLVGVLLAADGAGTLLGAALTTRITNAIGTARTLLLTGFVMIAGAALIPLGTGPWGYAAFALGNLIFGGAVVVSSVVTRTYRQVTSPPGMLSRVMATVRFVSWGAIPLGGLTAGTLAGLIGTRPTLLLFALFATAIPATLLRSPLRHLRNLTDHQPASPAQL